jgi:predicted nucleic acid-binding protein
MASVVVDTDVISLAFKKDSRIRGFRRHLIGRDWIISFMTLAELELWALGRNWGHATRERLERHLQAYQVQYSDRQLCRLWAEVTRGAQRKGRPIEVADAWHAATALAFDVPLVTYNPTDYAGIEGLTVLSGPAG